MLQGDFGLLEQTLVHFGAHRPDQSANNVSLRDLTEKRQIFENIFFSFSHHKIYKNEVWATYLTNLERAKCP